MVAFILPARTSADAIADGTQIGFHTGPRKIGNHPGAGARLHLRIARLGTRLEQYLPTQICTFRADVAFTATGVLRVDKVSTAHPGTVEGLHALLANAEQGSPHPRERSNDRVAQALGFADYAEFWAVIAKGKNAPVIRTVFGWAPVEVGA